MAVELDSAFHYSETINSKPLWQHNCGCSLLGLPSEILEHVIHFLDIRSSLNLLQVCRSLHQSLDSSPTFWKAICQKLLIKRSSPLAHREYSSSEMSSFLNAELHCDQDDTPQACIHRFDCSDKGVVFWKQVYRNFLQLRTNVQHGQCQYWRFLIDNSPPDINVIALKGDMGRGQLNQMYGRTINDVESFAEYDILDAQFNLDWNGKFAVMAVTKLVQGSYAFSEIFVWQTFPEPKLLYKQSDAKIRLNSGNFSIWDHFLIHAPSFEDIANNKKILMLFDLRDNLRNIDHVDLPNGYRKDGDPNQVNVDTIHDFLEVIETRDQGKAIALARVPHFVFFLIDIPSCRIEMELSLPQDFHTRYGFLYHVEHRPFHRNGMVLLFGNHHPAGAQLENEPAVVPAPPVDNDCLYSLLTINLSNNEQNVRLINGTATACFGMDITSDGHVLALVNCPRSQKGELWLYQQTGSTAHHEPSHLVSIDKSIPISLQTFDYEFMCYVEDSQQINTQPEVWTGDQQIRICHTRDIAVVLSNDIQRGIKTVFGLRLNDLGSVEPSATVLYSIPLDALMYNFDESTLALGVSNHFFAVGDMDHVVLWQVKDGQYLQSIPTPEHRNDLAQSDTGFDEGLGFLLMNDTEILTHNFVPSFYPDAFDIMKFW